MKRKKKVVVFGVAEQYRPVCEEALKEYTIAFVETLVDAVRASRNADVLVLNVDGHHNFAKKLWDYEGKVILITRSSNNMQMQFKLPKGEKAYPIPCNEVPQAIMQAFPTQELATA